MLKFEEKDWKKVYIIVHTCISKRHMWEIALKKTLW